MAESKEELKRVLRIVKEEGEKVGLKPNIQKTKIWSQYIMANKWRNDEQWEALFWGGSKITADGDCRH